MKDRSNKTPLRVWVPGCASGEEVYSIAICLLEYLGERASQTQIQIFGSDINASAIETARAGVYVENIARHVSEERLRRFFVLTGNQYRVAQPVRDLCIFARHDVTRDPPFSKLDLVSCRNLLIYLVPMLQKRVIQFFSLCAQARRPSSVGPIRNHWQVTGLIRNPRRQTSQALREKGSTLEDTVQFFGRACRGFATRTKHDHGCNDETGAAQCRTARDGNRCQKGKSFTAHG